MSKTGRRLALLIANNEYDDPKLSDLESPENDAETLEKILKSDWCGNFEVTSLYRASSDDAEDAIDSFFKDANQNDLLLFYYSGHGLRDAHDDLYFAFKKTRDEAPDSRSVSASFLKRRIDNSFCFSESIVTILDCCFSGLIANGRSKGGAGVYKSDFQMTGKGRYTLYAAGSGQEAKERDGQSVYTRHLIDALRFGGELASEPALTVRRLQEYLRKEVKKERAGQLPDWTISGAESDIVLARNLDAERNTCLTPTSIPSEIFASAQHMGQAVHVSELPSSNVPKNADLTKSQSSDSKSKVPLYGIAITVVGALAALGSTLLTKDPQKNVNVQKTPAFVLPKQSRVFAPSVLLYKQRFSAFDGPYGLTWSVKAHGNCGISTECKPNETVVQVGSDAVSDTRTGDTPITRELPLLCSNRIAKREGSYPVRFKFALSKPVALDSFSGKAEADYFCMKLSDRFLWHDKPLLSDNITTGISTNIGYRPEMLTNLSLSYRSTGDSTARFWVNDKQSGAWPNN